MKKTLIIDCGHGTATIGKQSPDGTLREFDNNRKIVQVLSKTLTVKGYKHFVLFRQWLNEAMLTVPDFSLSSRQQVANSFVHTNNAKDYLLLSIHSNANSMGQWQAARGVGVWLHNTRTDLHFEASNFAQQLAIATQLPLHGQGVHYRNLAMNSPHNPNTNRGILADSMILEIGFHDNRQDVEMMKAANHAQNVANGIVKSLEILYN